MRGVGGEAYPPALDSPPAREVSSERELSLVIWGALGSLDSLGYKGGEEGLSSSLVGGGGCRLTCARSRKRLVTAQLVVLSLLASLLTGSLTQLPSLLPLPPGFPQVSDGARSHLASSR